MDNKWQSYYKVQKSINAQEEKRRFDHTGFNKTILSGKMRSEEFCHCKIIENVEHKEMEQIRCIRKESLEGILWTTGEGGKGHRNMHFCLFTPVR